MSVCCLFPPTYDKPTMSRQQREFAFSSSDFQRVRRLIHEVAGISLSECKEDLVYGRLARRLRALGLKSFDPYLALIEARDPDEMQPFINSLTTNLTSFFREMHHFPVLESHARRHDGQRPYRVWCSACSTGEEAYSIAITLAEAFQGRLDRARIMASDLDTQVLETARRGVYPEERVDGIEDKLLRRYFQRGTGRNRGKIRIRPEMSAQIEFTRINLLDKDWPLEAGLDVIFCRNVMIYFDKPTQRVLMERFRKLIRPDGLLFCGHSESLMHCTDLFRNQGRTVYTPI